MKHRLARRSVGVLTLLMGLALCVTAFAEDAVQAGTPAIQTAVIPILNGQLSDAEKEALRNTDLSELDVDPQNMSGAPAIRVFHELFFPEIGEPLETLLTAAQSHGREDRYADYAVLDETPYLLRVPQAGASSEISPDKAAYAPTVPRYIVDLMALSVFPADVQGGGRLEGVYCFDGDASHQGAAVYLKTDQGVCVRYYEDPNAEAQLFTEGAFRAKADAYYHYLTSEAHNYNEDGEALGGGKMSFLSFTRSHGEPVPEKTGPTIPIVVLTVSCLVLATGAAVVVIVMKRKKGKARARA